MKKTKLITIVFLLVVLLKGPVIGDMTKSGTTTAQFLKIQVGARGIGMGGAYSACANDVSSIYWNPAGMTRIREKGAVSFSHTNWIESLNFNFAAAVLNLGNAGSLGLSLTSLTMPDMLVRTEFEPEGTGEYFSASDIAMGISYARSLTDRFSMGMTMKYVRQKIWHMTATAVAFDLGILFNTDLEWLTLGVSISNFGPKARYEGKDVFVNYDFDPEQWGDNDKIFADLRTDQWELPLLFRFGLNMELIRRENNQLIAAIEARHPNDNSQNVSLGLEYGLMKRFFLRGGYQNLFEEDSERSFTFGTGLVYFLTSHTPLHIDYAFSDWGRLDYVHRLSIEMRF